MSLDYDHYRCTPKMACFKCRKCFKHRTYQSKREICPDCGSELHAMGTHFRPPRQEDIIHWQTIELLYEAGVRYEVFDTHYHGWTEAYRKQGSTKEWTPFELHQILHENGIREHGQKNWQPKDNQWSGRRPTHPRDIPAFLDWWRERERIRCAIIVEVCDKLGIEPPQGLRGKLLLETMNHGLLPKPCNPLPKKRKRNKARHFDQ